MKALTICQPYAELILSGEKLVENRVWNTPYRGPLVIHAGKNRDWLNKYEDAVKAGRFPGPREPLPKDLVFGAIVGLVELVACVKYDAVGRQRMVYDERYKNYRRETQWAGFIWIQGHPHAEGPWCWVITHPRRFTEPILYRGEQGLFEIPDSILPVLK